MAVAVTPAVVLWGAAQHEVPDGSLVRDGVHFVAGRHLLDWLSSLSTMPWTKQPPRT